MRAFTAAVCALAAATAVSGASLSAQAAAAPSAPRCDDHAIVFGGHRAKQVKMSGAIRVYDVATRRDDGMGDTIYDYYACARPTGRLEYLGSGTPVLNDGEYGSNLSLSGLRIVGHYVVVHQYAGGAESAACYKYDEEGPCPGGTDFERVLDVAHDRACAGAVMSPAQLQSLLGAGAWSCPLGVPPAGAPATRYRVGLGRNSQPTDIAVGPDGALWFTDPGRPAIGRIDPATGVITEYSTGLRKHASPYDIALGPDGDLWFTDNSSYRENGGYGGAIGRIDPTTGAISEYSAGLPDGSAPNGIAAAGGAVWFTDSDPSRPAIGRVDPASGAITEYTQGLRSVSSPTSIAAGPDGALWFVDGVQPTAPGATAPPTPSAPEIGRIDPQTDAISEYSSPLLSAATPLQIVAGPDAALWFTLATARAWEIGEIVAATGTITSYAGGLGAALTLGGIAAAPDGALWYTAEDPGGGAVFGRLDPATGATSEYGVAPGSPAGIVAGPDGDLWAADTGGPDFGQFGYGLAGPRASIRRLAIAQLAGSAGS